MSELKCPFCNKLLQPTLRQSDEYWCENYDCPGTNIKWVGSQKLWQELIRKSKALDAALDWLGQVATPEKCDDDLCREFTKRKLAEIKTALEQKGCKMKQVCGFEIPLYKHAVKVFIGLPDDVPPQHAAHTDMFPDKQLVHIYIKDPNDFYVGYAMHECIHAADFILYTIGANMGCSPDDSEVRAYLAEYIYNKVAQALGYLKYKPRKLNKRINDA